MLGKIFEKFLTCGKKLSPEEKMQRKIKFYEK